MAHARINVNLFAASLRRLALSSTLAVAAVLGGCAGPTPLVQGPVSVRPVPPPSYAERTVTGGIYRANLGNVSLFSDQRKPQSIGDTIKIDISESLNASSVVWLHTGSGRCVKRGQVVSKP